MIDMLLYMKKIPFRYECALEFEEYTIEIFYWEHFGLMDNPAYSKNAFSKLQLYISHHIIPGVQLITTYETKEKPLTPEIVDRFIEFFFL